MSTLEEIIRKRLEEATKTVEVEQKQVQEETKQPESTTGLSSLFEGNESLSEEFKLKATTLFETAVTERVHQITEDFETKYKEQLAEATAELENNIDGFLSEVVQEWTENNKVALASQFKTRLSESLLDGIQQLFVEHNMVVEDEKVDVLDEALEEINKLRAAHEKLQEEVTQLKTEKILESFKDKMTSTEFDRFTQITENLKCDSETEYEKKLNIVLENFSKPVKQIITEEVKQPAPVDKISAYAEYLAKTV